MNMGINAAEELKLTYKFESLNIDMALSPRSRSRPRSCCSALSTAFDHRSACSLAALIIVGTYGMPF
jgi:hypothetical protein